jgi:hypothetical protein
VAAEVGLALHYGGELSLLDGIPPVVAAYTAKGRRRHTVILPFTLVLARAFRPRSQDSTVDDPGWRDPRKFWSEITPTNRLIMAYYLWPCLSKTERTEARSWLSEALQQATVWAAEVHLPAPVAPWSL